MISYHPPVVLPVVGSQACPPPKHAVQLSAPELDQYLSGQFMQVDRPGIELYVPGLHKVQDGELENSEYEPIAHNLEPESVRYDPARH